MKPKGASLTQVQQQLNKPHNSLRAIGERGHSLLKTTFKAPHRARPHDMTVSSRTLARNGSLQRV